MARSIKIETVTAVIARRAALLRCAELSEREGNFSLAENLRRKAQEINPTQIVELPDAGSLDDLWAAVGGTRHDGGGRPWWETSGIWRRLAAATRSIASRGTDSHDFAIDHPQANGFAPFCWESNGGAWGHRHWRVTGLLALRGEQLVVVDSTIAVESTARLDREAVSEWTAFRGRALDVFLAERLGWVLAQFAARDLAKGEIRIEGWEESLLTEGEEEAYHDLHPSPVAAWETTTGRVVLEDDACGSAYIFCAPAQKMELVATFLAETERRGVDLFLPISGALPQPSAEEELEAVLNRAQYLTHGMGQAYEYDKEARDAIASIASLGSPAERWEALKMCHPALAARTLADLWRAGELS